MGQSYRYRGCDVATKRNGLLEGIIGGLIVGALGTFVVLTLASITPESTAELWKLLGGMAILLILIAIPLGYVTLLIAGATQASRRIEPIESTQFALALGGQEIRRVLVAAGGGPHARLGLRVAARMAAEGGQLVLLRVVRPGSKVTIEKEVQALQRVAAGILGDGHQVEAQVVADDSVVEGILKEAAKGYDLLVFGMSEERSRLLAVTIPEQIVRRAPCSVVLAYRHPLAGEMVGQAFGPMDG